MAPVRPIVITNDGVHVVSCNNYGVLKCFLKKVYISPHSPVRRYRSAGRARVTYNYNCIHSCIFYFRWSFLFYFCINILTNITFNFLVAIFGILFNGRKTCILRTLFLPPLALLETTHLASWSGVRRTSTPCQSMQLLPGTRLWLTTTRKLTTHRGTRYLLNHRELHSPQKVRNLKRNVQFKCNLSAKCKVQNAKCKMDLDIFQKLIILDH